ncbi:uncharacterized protein LOC119401214 [Rhipicephalus sanguineus]|uniref:uncharacterized protein LOC119372627 n=1 Tax=Rhipicephalus sanguineus TaxID=34632 RepID=UPI001893FB9F|nr:uncharacterized protein LOC119372627 [Rhipicephalus sanguineus]XP_037523825.1 uncharacterized protein LOC119401214 [Rhipicephalus sanguineus]
MACSTVPQDITGDLRGHCKECECSGFQCLVDLAMTRYLLAGAFSVDTRLPHMDLSSASMRVPKTDIWRKLNLAVHHNSLWLGKYVASGQQTPPLTQKEGLRNLSKIIL